MNVQETKVSDAIKYFLANCDYGNGFSWAEIMAFCQIESSFNPAAYRFEPRLNDGSYGVMQILSKNARFLGFKGVSIDLCILEIGLKWGLIHLGWTRDYLAKHLPSPVPIDTVAAAYNAGVGNVIHGFHNPIYVQRYESALAYWTINNA